MLHKHLGVRFVYEEEQQGAGNKEQGAGSKTLTPEALAALPAFLRTALQAAAEAADLELTLTLIEQVRQDNGLLAEALANLAKGYRFDRLQALFAQIEQSLNQ